VSEYRFYLYHKDIARWTRIKDPIGWDALGKTIKRFGLDTSIGGPWHGIFFQYDVKLDFVKNGKTFIQKFFGLYGIEQDILLRIEKRNARNREFATHYEGRLNLSTYKVATTTVSCNVEQTGFIQKLKNRSGVKISMEATESQGGKTIVPPVAESILMHSKVLRKEDIVGVDGVAENDQFSIATGNYFLQGSYIQKQNELEEFFTYDVGLSTLDPVENFKYLYRVKEGGDYTYSGRIAGDIQSTGNSNFSVVWKLVYGKPGAFTTVNLFTETNAVPGFVVWNEALTTATITLAANDLIYLYATVAITSVGGDMTLRTYEPTVGFDDIPITIVADTIYPVTGASSFLVHEALDQTIKAITDTEAPFYSEHYGRTDIDYDADGDGALRAITSGNKLRGIDKPVFCSFKDLVDTCHSLDGVGFGIERINGVERVRAEPLTHWYQARRMMRLEWVLNIEKEVITDLYYNEAEGGIDKWANEKVRNLDEVNALRQWNLPITQLKNKMVVKSPYSTSGHSIERMRRESTQPSKDTPKDEDNFIFRLMRSGDDFIPEKDEAFDSVTGVISPETSYNLQDSPLRCFRRHGRMLRSALEKQKDQYIKFSFGEANTEMVSTLTSEGTALTEKADILISTLDAPLFVAEVYSVRAKLTYEQMQALEETDPNEDTNVWGFVEFAADDRNFKRGYLLEAQLSADSNEVKMKLIRANI
jgi:hypothetical protein